MKGAWPGGEGGGRAGKKRGSQGGRGGGGTGTPVPRLGVPPGRPPKHQKKGTQPCTSTCGGGGAGGEGGGGAAGWREGGELGEIGRRLGGGPTSVPLAVPGRPGRREVPHTRTPPSASRTALGWLPVCVCACVCVRGRAFHKQHAPPALQLPLDPPSLFATGRRRRRWGPVLGLGRVRALGLLQGGEEDAAAQADPQDTRFPALGCENGWG